MIYVRDIDTALGRFAIAATDGRLIRVLLPPTDCSSLTSLIRKDLPDAEFSGSNDVTDSFASQLLEYLDGRRTDFDLPYHIDAPPFHRIVLKVVAGIPYGQTATYADIAAAAGNPGATRAVGTANARNRLPIIIPCHRVVASSGLGGYGGGLAMKRQLLSLEASSRQERMHLSNP